MTTPGTTFSWLGTETDVRETATRYLAQLREIVTGEDVLAGLAALPGGLEGVLDFVALGMPAAFRPDKAEGEIGEIAFVLDAGDTELRLGLELRADGCGIVGVPADPTATVSLSLPDFVRICLKVLGGNDAYLDGKVVVTGDVVIVTILDDCFDAPEAALLAAVAGGHHA